MVDEKLQGRLRLAGLIPVVIIAVLAVSLALLGFRGPVFDTPDLALVLQFIFVFCVSILLVVVSARAYLISGSFNILLLGIAPMVSGVLLMVAQWAVTPSIGSMLTPNAAVTIGNLGILIASFLLMIGAILLLVRKERLWPDTSRKTVVGGSFVVAIVLIIGVVFISTSGSLPVFFTSSGSTVWREGVLVISGAFLAISCGLFGWTYFRSRSPTVYWYTLGLLSFATSLIGIVFTVKIGESVNWCGRLGLYLSGFFFLMAVLVRNTEQDTGNGISDRWASAFRNNREQVSNLFANMTELFFYGKIVPDSNGNPIDFVYLDVNRAWETHNSLKLEDVQGRRATEAFPAVKNEPNWIEPYGHVAITGEPITFDKFSPITSKWYHIVVYCPKKGYFVSITEDITETKQSQRALQEEKDRLTSLINSMSDEVWVADASGKLIMVNPAVTKEFDLKVGPDGIEVEKVASIFKVLRPDGSERPSEEAPPSRALKGEVVSCEEEIVRIPTTGEYRHRQVNAAPIRDVDGRILGSVSVVRDITERRRIEAELKRSNEELQQFAYLSSHDLQEPLRMMVSYMTLLERKYKNQLDSQAHEYISNAINGGTRMRKLIDDLLAYSRVETTAKESSPVDMKDVVEDAIKLLKVPIDESKADIYIEPMPTVLADGSQLQQVLQNLISNSLKFCGTERPMLHISAKEGTKEWTFSVKDNGIGLGMEYSDRIFQMFQRLHTKDQYPGTGVGLAIAKKIVERHGGRIWVESDEGKGATFFFTVPKAGKH